MSKDANVYFSNHQQAEHERLQRAREQYFQEHFEHIDIYDVLEALSNYSTNEFIDALRSALRGSDDGRRCVSAIVAAIHELYNHRADESS